MQAVTTFSQEVIPPLDFGIKNPKQVNHIAQNVPVTTAMDMVEHVEKFVDGRLDNQMLDTNFLIQDNTNQKLIYDRGNSAQLDAFMV